MSNRFEKNFNQFSRRDYYEHDERGSSSSRSHASSWPPHRKRMDRRGTNNYESGPPRRNYNNHYQPPRKERQPFQRSTYQSYKGGGRYPRKNRYKTDNRERSKKNSLGWHKIIIQRGGYLSKDTVLEAIKGLVDEPFTPIMFEPEGEDLVFYLENNGPIVDAIEKVARRITLPNSNEKLFIKTNQSAPPIRTFTEEQTVILKEVLSNRYSVEMNRLDLRNLHNDNQLTSRNIFCPLNRLPNMDLVVKMITENVKNVAEIDLGHNKINNLKSLDPLVSQCTNLARLSLEKNKLPNVNALDAIKGLQITDLTLKDNPLCDNFRDTETYISAVRQRFPKVLVLDSEVLPKPVVFALEEEPSKLPEKKGSFFCNEEAKNIISAFILQYYQIYDSDSRRPLGDAYTEDALMSISAAFPDTGPGSRYVLPYMQENRNLLKYPDSDRKQEKLVRGRSKIADFLCKLPGTVHDPNSLIVDLPIAEPQLIKVVISGVFKQATDKTVIRAFNRSLVIVPVGAGFCISNEMLFINNATMEQIKRAFKPKPTETTTSVPPVMPVVTEEQMKMIQEFQEKSGMLPVYCGMCLERCNWDFVKAGEMFMQLKAENKIPPEYYPSTT